MANSINISGTSAREPHVSRSKKKDGSESVTAFFTLMDNVPDGKGGSKGLAHEIICYGKSAEKAERLIKKGTKVAIMGGTLEYEPHKNKAGEALGNEDGYALMKASVKIFFGAQLDVIANYKKSEGKATATATATAQPVTQE